nr:hydroxysteroid dehydrogenase-like protein 1 [Aedes albopictus]
MEVLSYFGAVALLLWSYDTFKSLVELCWGLWKERTEGVDFVRRYGKWAVITGGSQGIGQQYARFFARKGLNVAIIALADESLEQTTKEIRVKYGVQVKPIPMDFAKGFENLKFIEEKLSGMEIGVLVNNVGIFQEVTYFDSITIESHQRVVNININAAIIMSRIVLPQMKQRGRGLVINMSSAYGLQPMPMTLMYGASKAFMLSFGQAMQEELRPFGVECQTVTPCFVRTQLTEEFGNTMLTRLIYTNVDCFGKFLTMTVGKTKRTTGYWMHALMVTGFKLIPADVESRLHHHMVKYILSKMK